MGLLDFLDRLGRFSYFALRAGPVALRALARPGELACQLHGILLGALPLGVIAGLTLGVVIWLHLHSVLARFGAAQLLPQALALAVVLEFAPTGAGLIVAGRSGASLGAELGSMRLTEQIDALEMLGISPMRQLVGPRVLAGVLALPLLTVFIAAFALLGSFGAECTGGSMGWQEYQNALLVPLRFSDVVSALVKTLVFGYLVAVSGCYFGLTAQGGTEGVGRAATRGVVVSIFLVLAANVVLVRIIQLLEGLAWP
jgi:phospholipid/cholesterol/gamma-HCH transport system permease protein